MSAEKHHSAVVNGLKGVTNPAEFEALVRHVLHAYDPDFLALIPTGTGEHGKPVPDPVDGLGYAPESSSGTWVVMEATTQTGSGLPKKLRDDFEKMSEAIPSKNRGRAKLALACASRLSSKLVEELHERAKREGVHLVLASGQWLADQITKPGNQWIGRQFLGVPPEFPDLPTLLTASATFLEQLGSRIVGGTGGLSRTETVNQLVQQVGRPLVELVGPSGSTKTSTAFLAGQEILSSGGIVVWIDESIVDDASNFRDAVDRAFQGQGYRFNTSVGRAILDGGFDARCLVIVDDIQRLSNAIRAVERVRSWARAIAPEIGGGISTRSLGSKVTILCTRWPTADQDPAIHQSKSQMRSSYAIHAILPTPDDVVSRLHDRLRSEDAAISEYAAREIAESLWYDPLLVGLFLESGLQSESERDALEPEWVWREFVSQGLRRAADYGATVEPLVERAWTFLGDYVLAKGSVTIDTEEIRRATVLEGLHEALGALIGESSLVASDGERLAFRHDRLRDWLVGSRIYQHYRQGQLLDKWSHPWDPFFVPCIAMATLVSDFNSAFVSEVGQHRPEALVEPLRYSPAEKRHPLLAAVHRWLDSCRQDWQLHPEVGVAVSSMAGALGEHLREVLAKLPPWSAVQVTRIAHGDTDTAIEVFRVMGLMADFPALRIALQHAKQRYGSEMISELKRALDSEDEAGRVTAIIEVAAALRANELVKDVLRVYKRAANKIDLLGPVLAFLVLSGVRELSDRVLPLIRDWLEWRQSREDELDRNPDYLRFAFSIHGIPTEAAKELANVLSGEGEDRLVSWLLHHCRTPGCTELLIRSYAKDWANHGMQDETWFFDSTTIFRRFEPKLNRRPISPEERRVVVELARDDSEPLEVRKAAVRLWEKVALRAELPLLRSLRIEGEKDRIQLARIRAGESRLIAWLEEKLPGWPHYIGYAKYVWSPEMRDAVDRWLGNLISSLGRDEQDSRNALVFAMPFLVNLPREDGRELFQQRIDRWPVTQCTIEAALLLGGASCLEWAKKKLRQHENPRQLLEFFMTGFGTSRGVPRVEVDAETILAWEDLLTWMSPRVLGFIFGLAESKNLHEWAANRLRDRLQDYHRRRFCPTRQDLVEQLQDGIERGRIWSSIYSFEEAGIEPREAMGALREALSGHDLEAAAVIIEEFLVRYADRETLEDFWKAVNPEGKKAQLVRDRTRYIVASRHPPVN